MNNKKINSHWISPTICVTHRCNLNCIYCYEKQKDTQNELTFSKAVQIINDIFDNAGDEIDGIEFCFIGGEPLLRFDLIKDIVEFYENKPIKKKYIFSATTNGTILTEDMKNWFKIHKRRIVLCLSLDGTPKTHNYNRSNSFEKIDFNFFIETYPNQGVKMTLSEYSLPNLFENIEFIHKLGFKRIKGVNLFEGDFDWSEQRFLYMVGKQLKLLLEYYCDPNHKNYFNQLFNVPIGNMVSKIRRNRKNCGIGGNGASFYDVDGTKYPCVMCTPMTLNSEKLSFIKNIDFMNDSLFVDYDCNEDCYIYPVCNNCPGSNFVSRNNFARRDKTKCNIRKLIVLFNAEYVGRKMIEEPKNYSEVELYNNIEAIKKIKELYFDEFQKYFI